MITHEDINPKTGKAVAVQGSVFILCGTTGTGKTSFIRDKLQKIPLQKVCFDIDNEYKGICSQYPIDRNKPIAGQITGFKKYCAPLWEHCTVYSEAGMFLPHGSIDFDMREVLKSARRRGVFCFFDFHSLSEVPIEMLKYCNFLVLKKTVMETREQLRKFSAYPEIMEKYKQVMSSKNNFETRIIVPRNLQVKF